MMTTPKEYLKQYRRITEQIRQLDNDVAELMEERSSIQIRTDGMPGGNEVAKRVEELAIRIVDLEKQNLAKRNELLSKREEVRQIILAVPNAKLSKLLDLRYVHGKTWEEIADEIETATRHVYRLHGLALLEAGKVMEEQKKI